VSWGEFISQDIHNSIIMYQILTKCPLFKGLNENDIEILLGRVQHFIKSYSIGEMIAQAEERCDYMICVLNGSVRGEMVDYSGKTIKIEDIHAPKVLAIAFLFGQNNKYPVNIIANESVKLMFIPRNEVVKLLQENQMVLQNFLNAVSSRTQFLSNKIRFLSFKTIKGKLAQYLLKLTNDDRPVVELPISQTNLAEFFGVTRPSLARVFGDLEDEGIIKVKRRLITIHDRDRLKSLLLD
jgi:CRP-like cAMP-binding protein